MKPWVIPGVNVPESVPVAVCAKCAASLVLTDVGWLHALSRGGFGAECEWGMEVKK